MYNKHSGSNLPQDERAFRTALSLRADLRADGILRIGTFSPAFLATLLRTLSRGTYAAGAAHDVGGICADRGGGMAGLVP